MKRRCLYKCIDIDPNINAMETCSCGTNYLHTCVLCLILLSFCRSKRIVMSSQPRYDNIYTLYYACISCMNHTIDS